MEGTRHTVNNKDQSATGGDTRNAKEIYMVLSKGHNGGVVARIERRLLDISPRYGRRVCDLHQSHVKGIQLAMGKSI